ncbi:unnamed protein product, partial [Leptidea sinapis]
MTLNDFFSSACRPGPWSSNATVDQNLKRQFPSLCSLCGGENSDCSRYNIDMGVSISGVSNDNRHIQALECLRRGNGSRVAYVAWQHVREFFNIRAPQDATSYALMCEDGTIQVLTNEVLAQTTAPCSLVKQPWKHTKCTWVRTAAYSLGIEPAISCQQRSNIFECLRDIRDNNADFIAAPSNYAYVAFVSAAHERDVISSTECDYMKSVGEFFDGACAPGASFNASVLCSHCQPSSIIMGNYSQNDFTCAYDYSNLYYGNNGTAACLANPNMDVAFVELQNFSNDPLLNSLNVLLDALDEHFGYNAAISAQLVNLEIYSPFDSVNDLLFKDTVVGLAEPSSDSPSAPANNYNNLFRHLDSCTSSASRTFFSFVTFAVMA